MKTKTLRFLVTIGLSLFSTVYTAKAVEVTDTPNDNLLFSVNSSQLTPEENEILEEGRISRQRRVAGGLIGTTIGFGLGHVATGEYLERGWVFTLGELGTAFTGLLGFGIALGDGLSNLCESSNCHRSDHGALGPTLMLAGGIGFAAFKGWEIYDVWSRPLEHNRKYDEIQKKIGREPEEESSWHLIPIATQTGGGLGFRMKF